MKKLMLSVLVFITVMPVLLSAKAQLNLGLGSTRAIFPIEDIGLRWEYPSDFRPLSIDMNIRSYYSIFFYNTNSYDFRLVPEAITEFYDQEEVTFRGFAGLGVNYRLRMNGISTEGDRNGGFAPEIKLGLDGTIVNFQWNLPVYARFSFNDLTISTAPKVSWFKQDYGFFIQPEFYYVNQNNQSSWNWKFFLGLSTILR